jgi:protoporphyrinogen/coproporphyrinogen III oxidase
VISRIPAVVVGGGISGLTCAYALRKAGVKAQLLEASARVGGAIQSEKLEGYLIELGPQSLSATPQLRSLIRELGIDGDVVHAPPSAPRYVLVNGKLRNVPLSPPELLKSSLLGMLTKMSLGRDAIGHSKPPEHDESVAKFVRRKFTSELLDRLVGPFVSGIYAGDPERLSLRSAFPQVYEAERIAGSVIRGLKAAAEKAGTAREKPTLMSFRDGVETLTRALQVNLGAAIRTNTEVTSVRRDAASGTFELQIRSSGGHEEILNADQLILTTPPNVTGRILRQANAEFARHLGAIEYAPMAVVALGYARANVTHTLNGFGFLTPRSANLRTLGTVWNSSLFPGRAPEGHVLLTSFVGGATDRRVASQTTHELLMAVGEELMQVLGCGKPVFSRVILYPHALPQYNLGHSDHLASIERLRAHTPGLWLAGNYLRGPSIGTCVEQALNVAQEVASRLE